MIEGTWTSSIVTKPLIPGMSFPHPPVSFHERPQPSQLILQSLRDSLQVLRLFRPRTLALCKQPLHELLVCSEEHSPKGFFRTTGF